VAARNKMNEMATGATGLVYGPAPFQDHHGGALWLKDAAQKQAAESTNSPLILGPDHPLSQQA
jgi:hypothetical protein